MKKIFNLSLMFFLIVFISNAQYVKQKEQSTEDKKVFTVAEQGPQFPGGEEAFKKYLLDNIKYPENAKKNGIAGTVYVAFVIDKEGKIIDPKVLRGASAELDVEALRVVSNMPQWTPGTQKGNKVNVQYNIPIEFKR